MAFVLRVSHLRRRFVPLARAIAPAVAVDRLAQEGPARGRPGLATTAVTFTSVTNVNAAAVPLNLTEFTPVKFVPWMVTVVPTLPLAGLKLVIVGMPPPPPVTMKLLPLCALPSDVVTMIGPVDAPLGTLTVTLCPDALTVNPGAFVPLNVTEVVPAKFVPWISTVVPMLPLAGLKLVIVGEVPAAAGNAVIERRKRHDHSGHPDAPYSRCRRRAVHLEPP